jgi:signal transduction histidine kinase
VPLDLSDLIRTMAEAFDGWSSDHRVRFEVPEVLQAELDPKALYQVLGHLVDNAIKYSPAGTMILLRARSADDCIEVEVYDEGVGIPEGVDVFAPFQRGEDAAAAATSGAGLGLHIVQSLTQAMGGTVDARRNEHRGSTFRVRFPVAP